MFFYTSIFFYHHKALHTHTETNKGNSLLFWNQQEISYILLDTGKLFVEICILQTGQKFRMLLDTGAGSSFISTTLAQHLGSPPLYWEEKSMETMTTVSWSFIRPDNFCSHFWLLLRNHLKFKKYFTNPKILSNE